MTQLAHAAKTLYNNIADETYSRAMKWFDENPDEEFCYWGKESFFKEISQEELERNSIKDIEDQTRVQRVLDTIVLSHFCKKYRESLHDLIEANVTEGQDEQIKWFIEPDGDNYIMTLKKA